MITASKFAIICAAAALAVTPAVAKDKNYGGAAVMVLVSAEFCGTRLDKTELGELIILAAHTKGIPVDEAGQAIGEAARIVADELAASGNVGAFCAKAGALMGVAQ